MNEVTVKRDQLLEILRKNRETHNTEHTEAWEGYRLEMLKSYKKAVKDVMDGGTPPIHFPLLVPQDHTKEYDTAIQMLEMSVNDTVTLDVNQFNQYVRDEWHWKQFVSTANTLYGAVGKMSLASSGKAR